ncbi:MAG TPA: gas vesicle protein GvpO [Trebonia sp.]|nr:gas vesicle protein GvpO [Trebonia sp.]
MEAETGDSRDWADDRGPRLTAAQAGRHGLRQIADLTGKDPEGVSGVEPAQDGWLVTVEVIEDQRIPSATDVLASYQTEIGPDGDLLSYRRTRRYSRGRGDDGGGA